MGRSFDPQSATQQPATVRPPFDPEEFAWESESRLRLDELEDREGPSKSASRSAKQDISTTTPPPFVPEAYALETETRLRKVALAAPRPPHLPRAAEAGPAPLTDQWIEQDPFGHAPVERPVGRARPASESPELLITWDAQDVLGADAIPAVALPQTDLEWFVLSPDAVRVLSYVNGTSRTEDIFKRAAVSRDEGSAILLELAEQGIISFK
jgi:hypothetical protein